MSVMWTSTNPCPHCGSTRRVTDEYGTICAAFNCRMRLSSSRAAEDPDSFFTKQDEEFLRTVKATLGEAEI